MYGDGSYRDTLSVLEKVLVGSKDASLNADLVARIVGAPTNELVNRLLLSIEEGNISNGLTAIRKAKDEHVDMKVYLRMILQKLRVVLMLRYDKNAKAHYKDEFTEGDMTVMERLATEGGKKINSHVLYAFLDATREIGFSSIPSLPIELALIKVFGEEK